MKRNVLVTMVITALFAAMTTIMTAYIGHMPIGLNGGYIHFGDALIYLAACFLPMPYAMAAGAVGAGLADLLTAPAWMAATIVIKALLVLPFTRSSEKIICVRNVAAVFIAAAVTIGGYYIAEGIMFGDFYAPLAGLVGGTVQAGGSAVLFLAFAFALDRGGVKRRLKLFYSGK